MHSEYSWTPTVTDTAAFIDRLNRGDSLHLWIPCADTIIKNDRLQFSITIPLEIANCVNVVTGSVTEATEANNKLVPHNGAFVISTLAVNWGVEKGLDPPSGLLEFYAESDGAQPVPCGAMVILAKGELLDRPKRKLAKPRKKR